MKWDPRKRQNRMEQVSFEDEVWNIMPGEANIKNIIIALLRVAIKLLEASQESADD